jgi:hypothetical protein
VSGSQVAVAVRRIRARRLRRLLLLIGVLVAALLVVALLPQGQHRGAFTVATSARSADGAPSGVAQGVLRAARSGNRVCFSVDAAQGRVLLVLPPGWSADTELRLLDAAGQARATAGVRTAFLGSPGATASLPGCAATGRLWYTRDVRLPSRQGS